MLAEAAQDQKRNLYNQIQAMGEELDKKRRAYEALLRFKDSVYRSQKDFNIANDHSRVVLNDLLDVSGENTVVKKYQDGMGNTLTGIGMKVVDGAFYGLLGMIDLKIAGYQIDINVLQGHMNEAQLAYNTIDLMV